MSFKELNNRNINENDYKNVLKKYEKHGSFKSFTKTVKRSIKKELFSGLKVTFIAMKEALFNDKMHTVQYPAQKLPIGPRYRAVHKLLALLESGENRCIGCGLCEKICISDCIRMDTKIDENSRKEVLDYTINFGRCIFCGYCAEVCPELAIVHGGEYESASEQRAHYVQKDDLLTPIDKLKLQQEYDGYGAVSPDADEKIKKTPLEY